MRTLRLVRRMRKMSLVGAVLASGMAFENSGCTNTLLSLTPCGTILAGCTPGDWANLIFPYLDLPDFQADPSCTIPGACGGGDALPNLPGFFDNATGVVQPTVQGSGGAGGGGGGVGGGGGGGGGPGI